ncbi:hypothetical protein, partial [Mesorhizobium sp. LSHC426A00]|uniref:hypothetical protein n=1 Tax=Mesorhizobium sp. LSHC426A00 TaxID=1287298 RepID=UPI001AEBB1FB
VRKQNVFDGSAGGLNFSLGHGGVPSRESGDVNNHQPAMTAPLSEFAELSAHYPLQWQRPIRKGSPVTENWMPPHRQLPLRLVSLGMTAPPSGWASHRYILQRHAHNQFTRGARVPCRLAQCIV